MDETRSRRFRSPGTIGNTAELSEIGVLKGRRVLTYKHTLYASYLGYVTQAIVNNLPPLLFIVFNRDFGIPLEKIGLLVGLNFVVQIVTDLVLRAPAG